MQRRSSRPPASPERLGRGAERERRASPAPPSLFQLYIAQLEVIVAHWRQIDIVAARPHHDLLVQRDVGVILLDDAESLADQLVALLAVELDLDLLDQLIERGVRIAALVPRPVAEVLASRLGEVAQHVQGVQWRRGPAQ